MGTGPGGAGYKKDPAPVRSTQGQDRCRFCGATLFAPRRGLDARRKSPSRRANTLPSCNGDPRPKLLGAAGRGCRGLAPCLPAEVFAPCLLPFLPGPGPFARPSAAHNSCAHRPFPSYRALLGCGIAASLPPHRFTALYTHPRRKVKIRNFILWLREVRGVHTACPGVQLPAGFSGPLRRGAGGQALTCPLFGPSLSRPNGLDISPARGGDKIGFVF